MTNSVKNAGKYNKHITIVSIEKGKDVDGFNTNNIETIILETYAEVVTTKGYTLIQNDTDFEKAYTRFTIRYPAITQISRDMFIRYNNKLYSIEYLNNINEESIELEIQAKVVKK